MEKEAVAKFFDLQTKLTWSDLKEKSPAELGDMAKELAKCKEIKATHVDEAAVAFPNLPLDKKSKVAKITWMLQNCGGL